MCKEKLGNAQMVTSGCLLSVASVQKDVPEKQKYSCTDGQA